jgi:hypothetical protein
MPAAAQWHMDIARKKKSKYKQIKFLPSINAVMQET